MIISWFQNINSKKEGKIVNGLADVKNELRMMTVDDGHFAMEKEFVQRHHQRKLINYNTKDMFKDKVLFMLSTKFQLTHEFLKHFGYFTDNNFNIYIQHLLGRVLGPVVAFSKVMVHNTNLVHASHHTRHKWVERRKWKQVVPEVLVKLQLDLKFMALDRAEEGFVWR